jgi:hypothetical protein
MTVVIVLIHLFSILVKMNAVYATAEMLTWIVMVFVLVIAGSVIAVV